mmetsp:Transcript_29825/g.39691  ORF Transcript_29825/g.39691 Transcript_29825/m.39691 type:complete len:96 (+) Transcript_29825:442-729(+)
MGQRVLCSDKDIRQCCFLLVNMATILNWMKTDMHKKANRSSSTTQGGMIDDDFPFSKYSDKMVDYAPVFDFFVKDFIDETFGEYANQISQEELLE